MCIMGYRVRVCVRPVHYGIFVSLVVSLCIMGYLLLVIRCALWDIRYLLLDVHYGIFVTCY